MNAVAAELRPRAAHYVDRDFNMRAAKIAPGQYFASDDELVIVTVLGSCVSVCLHDPLYRIGGMNHFMLPEQGESGAFSVSARYGAHAMELLINELLKRGARREALQAKVFGAGRVLQGITDVGERNARFALDYLTREKIPMLARDLGGEYPRKLYYFPQTGRALVKLLRSQTDKALAPEQAYRRALRLPPAGGDVDLF